MLSAIWLVVPMGCGHRQGTVAASLAPKPAPPAPMMLATLPSQGTFHSKPAAISFDYPLDWLPEQAKTAVFAIAVPAPAQTGYASLSLDIPKLPWHLPGMITLDMVRMGYLSDLKKNQIHDAVMKDCCPLKVSAAHAEEITSVGTENGKPSIDLAVILIHADQVYILSADSDQTGCELARRTLDAAVDSIQWAK